MVALYTPAGYLSTFFFRPHQHRCQQREHNGGGDAAGGSRQPAGEHTQPAPLRHRLPQEVSIVTEDGFRLPGLMTLPLDFDSTAVAKYPVHFEVYGGPDTPYVRDRWRTPGEAGRWFAENGIIHLVVDPRSAGHNGRAGEDMAYRQLTVWEIRDYVAWAGRIRSRSWATTRWARSASPVRR